MIGDFQDSFVVLLTVLGHIASLEMSINNSYLGGVSLEKVECLGLELSVVRDVYHVFILDYYYF
jgi:hypothetical protein